MKISLIISLFPLSVRAFAPSFRNSATFVRSSTAIGSANAEAVAEAMAITKKFGARSKEAAAAWDAIEEMDAADNSAAYKGGVSDDECATSESAACKNYMEKVQMLGAMLDENRFRVENIKKLTSEVQSVRIAAPAAASSTVDPVAMKNVLAEAREAAKKFGDASAEARLAWETVEEVASSDRSGALGGGIEDECLVEALEACEALEELNRAVQVASSSDRFSG